MGLTETQQYQQLPTTEERICCAFERQRSIHV